MAKSYDLTQYEAAHRKRTLLSALLIFLAMPVTIFIGIQFDQNKYMIISVLLLIYTMLPFFMVFENRKPKAREIVLIAMMSALTVCVHIFFHITLPLQIGTAMIIISGISLGPEAGFLIGAISRFVCNFYMGQGPWTPWQMFCWGILGFLAGMAFNKVDLDQLKSRNFKLIMGPVICILFGLIIAYISYQLWPGRDESLIGWRLYAFGLLGLLAGMLLQRKRLPVDGITLAVFTFFTTFIIYGGIMNLCALVISAGTPGGNSLSLESMRVLYISGAPYDAFHAGSAALCIFLFGNSIIRKLERIKIKYGIYK
ncbi:ECF transporter S component [Emergencia timonensis]|uniref:ECF transporter S component n=1 Tax=Emergencia timonensis TaxID=1776384 RepID=UPI0039950B60